MKSDAAMVVDVCAIDVGHFSVKLSLGRKLRGEQSIIATTLFPSLAPRLPAGLTPQSALQNKPDGTVVEVNGEFYFVGRDAILFSSGREPREVLADYSETDKYKALLLGALQYIFEDSKARSELIIRQLVVGLPLTTFGDKKAALTERLQGEHLLPDPTVPGAQRRVTVKKVIVIVQPQGALINYGVTTGKNATDSQWTVVVDAGGGTLDWYVARGRQPNWLRSGAYPKSMLACAYAVADKIDPTWRDNFEIIERIDKAIRNQEPSFATGGKTYQLDVFESAIESVLKESTAKMVARLGSLDNIDAFLFTGGGARVYRDYFSKNYPRFKDILHMDEEPVFSNVKGFQLVGELLSKSN